MVFENYGAQRFAFVPQASLKLFAELKHSGVVVDFGGDMTQISPVENGYTSYYSSGSFRVSGNSVDKYLMYSLMIGNEIYNSADLENCLSLERVKSDLKEKSWDESEQSEYILPDKKEIIVDRSHGYDKDALAYLYFNSEIIKSMDN